MRLLLFLFPALLCPLLSLPAATFGSGPGDEKHAVNAHVVGKSRIAFIKFYEDGIAKGKFDYASLVRELAPRFAGIPYGASDESCPEGKTLVNFESFDCVTFVETFWALSYTLHEYLNKNLTWVLGPV